MKNYRQASFGGALFYVSQSRDAFGRRGAHHEFPYKDRGLWDDLGAKDGHRQIEAYITDFIPGGFALARERLVAALSKGEGELVHPFLGRYKVVCTDYSIAHNEKELGICRVSITFIDADTSAATVNDNHAARLSSGCESALAALTSMFSDNFSVAGVLSFVKETTAGRLDSFLSYISQGLLTAGEIKSVMEPLLDSALKYFGDRRGRSFSFSAYAADRLNDFHNNKLSLDSTALAENILGLTALLIPASAGFDAAYGTLDGLWSLAASGRGYQAPPKAASAHSVTLIKRNFQSLDFLFMATAAVQAASLTPRLVFSHQQQAAGVREDILTRFDFLAERSQLFSFGGTSADKFYQALRAISADALKIIAATAPSLALTGRKVLNDSWPSLKLSYELYEKLDREADLVKRNRAAHPGFMPGGVALEYLVDV